MLGPSQVFVAALAVGLAVPALGVARPSQVAAAALVVAAAALAGRPQSATLLTVGGVALALGALAGDFRLRALTAPAAELRGQAETRGIDAWGGVLELQERPRRVRYGWRARARLSSPPGAGATVLVRGDGHPPRALDLGSRACVRGRLQHEDRAPAGRGRADGAGPARPPPRLAGLLRLSQIRYCGHRHGVAGAIDAARRRSLAALRGALGSADGELAAGLVLGLDEWIAPSTREDFRASGLGHLLAVSGQNVALLLALAGPFVRVAVRSLRLRWALLALLIVLYVPLAGAGAPLQRAAVMGLAGLAASAAARPQQRWHALALAAVATLLLDPRQVHDASWQLSFAAVAGLAGFARPLERALAPPLRGRPEGPLRPLLDAAQRSFAAAVAMTVAASLATAPITLATFGALPAGTLAANLVALPAVAPAMWFGMVLAASGQLSLVPGCGSFLVGLAGKLIGPCLQLALRHLEWSAETFAVLPQIDRTSGLKLLAPALLAGALVLLAPLPGARPARRVLAAAIAAYALWVVVELRGPGPPSAPTITFLDVGQGDAVLVQDGRGASVLFDSGPPEARVVRLLRRAGVSRLDVVVATHPSRDHHGGLRAVVEQLRPRLFVDGGDGTRDPVFRAARSLAVAHGARLIPGLAPLRLSVGRISVQVLSPRPRPPGPPPADPNPRAIVALVEVAGVRFLTSGDAESGALSPLRLPAVEIIKVPHHGSADPGLPAVLRRLRPAIAVIEVGAGNPFGHPSPSTLAALARHGARVWRTDRDGTVTISLRRRRLIVETAGG